MKNFIRLFLSMFLAVNAASAQDLVEKKIQGNGIISSKARHVSEYDKVTLNGLLRAELVGGQEGNIKVKAEENLVPYITTEVNQGILEISVEEGYALAPSNGKEILITVPFENLDAIHIIGSGEILTTEAIKTENFETKVIGSGVAKVLLAAENATASIIGSGGIELQGNVQAFTCKVIGSGDINAKGFKSEKVDATGTGSGDIVVYVTEEFRAKVNGSGDIKYRGNPEKEYFKISGLGSVFKD